MSNGAVRSLAVTLCLCVCGCPLPNAIASAAGHRHSRHVHGRRSATPAQGREANPVAGPAGHAPAGPSLTGGGSGGAGPTLEQPSGISSVGGDQLVENGFASPLCRGAAGSGLSSAAQSNCRTSGFVAAPAPTNDYGLDVHIDTGAFGLSSGGLLSVIQNVVIAPVWQALEWIVHALVVMLEWCYSLELLGPATAGTIGAALRGARAGFTDPWLALVLALASVLVLYHGLLRRRVADTLGGALTTLAMMGGGLWLIADPLGTVGAVGQWANQASIGTLAAVAQGTPTNAPATLADRMRALYSSAIELPWCYLEFGNVRWCSDPSRLDPRVRSAALAIVAHHEAGCTTELTASCSVASGSSAEAAHGEELVREASTNGGLFLAFPANGPQRNSINDEGSLLRAVCQSEDATKCAGPAAAEAEFRTDGGTFPRLLGLLAIAVGVLGMALTFGLIALRLLAAAFFSLLLLLLAPFAVLIPAFGDGGRALFAAWAGRLFGAVVSKLVFSFVLGALLTMQRLLAALDVLGWWTQWLLISAFWWTVFFKRHQAAAMLQGARGAGSGQGRPRPLAGANGGGRAGGHFATGARLATGAAGSGERFPLVRGAERLLQGYGVARHPRRWTRAQKETRLAPGVPRDEELKRRQPGGGGGSGKEGPKSGPKNDRGRLPPPSPRRRHGDKDQSRLKRVPGGGRSRAGAPSDLPPRQESSGRGQERVPRTPTQSDDTRKPKPGTASGNSGPRERQPMQRPASERSPVERPTAERLPADRLAADRPSLQRPPVQRPPTKPGAGSPIMEDAFAVMERRKRQLGFDSRVDEGGEDG